jgi:hypothetical protein
MKALQELANQLKQLGVKECTIKLNYKDHIALSIKNQNEMNEKGIDAVMTPVGSQENSSFVINGKPERMSYYIVDGIIINYYSDKIKTIPLTEELLLRFGFYKVKNSSSRYSYRDGNWLFNNFWITEEFKPCIENYKDNCMDIIGMKLHFVHQLQNLYFALTGEELIHDEWVVTKDNHPSIVNILKD